METGKPTDDSPTSLASILRDVITSIVILLGALLIRLIERLFDNAGPPTLVAAILKLSELSLFFFFFANLLTAIGKFLLKAGELLIIARQVGAVSLLRMSRPSLGSLSRAFKTGLVASVLVTLLVLVSVPLARLPSIILIGLTVVLVAYVIIATIQNRGAILDKGFGFAVGSVVILCVVLMVAFIVRQLGGGESLQAFLDKLSLGYRNPLQ
jgi:hypothetical protein